MLWYGVVWYGVAWYGTVLGCDVAWRGIACYGMVCQHLNLHGIAYMVWIGNLQCSMVSIVPLYL